MGMRREEDALLHFSKVVPRLLVPEQSWNSKVQRIAAVCSGAVPGRQAGRICDKKTGSLQVGGTHI